jgi:hypothetical protein
MHFRSAHLPGLSEPAIFFLQGLRGPIRKFALLRLVAAIQIETADSAFALGHSTGETIK